jgi:Rrf2 family protein
MKITRACDYALKVLVYIASENNKNKIFMRNELSKLCDIPDSFLGKILQALARENILVSERGKKGGFKLQKKPEDISFYDVIKAVEGDITINDCLVDKNFCNSSYGCRIQSILEKVRQNLISDLKKYSLEDIIS